jgi:hypothetical protein
MEHRCCYHDSNAPFMLLTVGSWRAGTSYLIPAITKLPGLLSYYAGASPDGSMVHVSVWESEEKAQQMGRLKEMIVDARADAEQAGVTFIPIVNYPVDWAI